MLNLIVVAIALSPESAFLCQDTRDRVIGAVLPREDRRYPCTSS
jgi:hypothetical protein